MMEALDLPEMICGLTIQRALSPLRIFVINSNLKISQVSIYVIRAVKQLKWMEKRTALYVPLF